MRTRTMTQWLIRWGGVPCIVVFLAWAGVSSLGAHTVPLPDSFQLSHDRIPNFVAMPTIQSQQDGAWDHPQSWDGGRIPGAQDRVLIRHAITYGVMDGITHSLGIAEHGALRFHRDRSTRLAVGTLMVLPGGTLDIGTVQDPIPGAIQVEIVFRDIPIDITDDGIGVYDPSQFGTGLLAIDGTVTIHGAAKSPTFVRLTREPAAGDRTVVLEQVPGGWQAGDTLILPDTRQMRKGDVYGKGARSRIARLAPQWETPTIQAISGTTITLVQPLQFAHKGARAVDGTLDFLPHVGNLTRNIVVRSENPTGTRGHILLTRLTDVQIRYAEMLDMGRTTVDLVASTTFLPDGSVDTIGPNQIGRYAVHVHRKRSTGGQDFVIEGNAVRNTRKWGIALHDSHYGLVRQNVVYNADGAGIVTEDGSESYNRIERNFVVRNEGSGFLIEGRGRIQEQHGHDGSGFWFRGGHNYVIDNVSANNRNAGFLYNALLAQPAMIPLRPGNDPTKEGEGRLLNVQTTPLLEFARNEVYSPNLHALELWQNNEGQAEVSYRNVITDFRAWHFAGALFELFYTDGIRVRGVKARGDVAALTEPSVGFTPDNFSKEPYSPIGSSGHLNATWRITQADIQGLRVGIQGSIKEHVLEESVLRNEKNILVHLRPQVRELSKLIDLTPHTMLLRNVRFDGLPGAPLVHIHTGLFSDTPGLGLSLANTAIVVEDYNGVSGHNRQVFFPEQRPSFIVPSAKGRTPLPRAPDALQEGISNQENYDRYGLTLLSAFPDCTDTTTHPEILGYTCFLERDRTSPILMEHPEPLRTATTAHMTWTVDEPATGRLTMYRIVNKQQVELQTIEVPTLQKTHTLGLSGLTPGIPYRYILSGQDAHGNAFSSPEMTVIPEQAPSAPSPDPVPDPDPVPPPPPPPTPPSSLTMTNVRIGRNGADVYVQWMTPVAAVATVAYGLTPDLGTIATRPASTNPRFTLSGLPENTLYYAVLSATDASGNTVSTGMLRLGTRKRQNLPPASPVPDTTPPVIYNPIVLFTEATAATIMWEIDELAQNVLEYGTTPTLGLQQLPTTQDQLMGHAHVEFRSGLTPNTTYYFRGTATDASGNRTVTPVLQFTTQPLDGTTPTPDPLPGDTTGPLLMDLHEHAIGASMASVTWLTDEPGVSMVRYGTTASLGSMLSHATVGTHHTMHLCGLQPETAYFYQAIATDALGNTTASPVMSFTTRRLD